MVVAKEIKNYLLLWLLPLVSLIFFIFHTQTENQAEKKYGLRILSYSSLLNEWGPGPILTQEFEKQTGIQIQWIDGGDSTLLVERLQLSRMQGQVDLVLGLDQWNLARALKNFEWLPMNQKVKWHKKLPKKIFVKNFAPIDWAPLTFIGRSNEASEKKPEKKWTIDEFLESLPVRRVSLQDPRTSTPGLQLLLWIQHQSATDEIFKARLQKLMTKEPYFSSSWSTSYGIFKKSSADYVYSYLTSPIYSLVEEKDPSILPIKFKEPLPIQVEYGGIPANCENCKAAEAFMKFILSHDAQVILMQKNYMLPAIEGVQSEDLSFDLALPSLTAIDPLEVDLERVQKDLRVWESVR